MQPEEEWFRAAYDGDVDAIDRMIRERVVDVNLGDEDDENSTALMQAADRSNREVVERLLQVPGIDVNVTDDDGWDALYTAIRWATSDDDDDIALIAHRLLCVPGIEVNTSAESGNTNLHWAYLNGNFGIALRLLMMPGINVDARNDAGERAVPRDFEEIAAFFRGLKTPLKAAVEEREDRCFGDSKVRRDFIVSEEGAKCDLDTKAIVSDGKKIITFPTFLAH